MNHQSDILNSFSKHLFWDVDKSKIDQEKHANYIINSVLQYGLYIDWKILVNNYGLKEIINTAIKNKNLDKKTISFLALISNTPINKFVCFTTEQSTPKHWNF